MQPKREFELTDREIRLLSVTGNLHSGRTGIRFGGSRRLAVRGWSRIALSCLLSIALFGVAWPLWNLPADRIAAMIGTLGALLQLGCARFSRPNPTVAGFGGAYRARRSVPRTHVVTPVQSDTMKEHILGSLREAQSSLEALLANDSVIATIESAGRLLIGAFEARGRVFACGNGGSMCDAMHFAEELTGRYRKDRAALPATAISDAGHLTCVGNDLGYEQVFSRYLEAHARPGDCLVALTTSGSSKNILRAANVARALDVRVIGLTGGRGSPMSALCDVHICTPGGAFADRVQELHIKVLHILIEIVERHFFPGNYSAAAS